MTHTGHNFQSLLVRPDLLKHPFAPLKRRTLVFVTCQYQNRDLDLWVTWWFGVGDNSAVRAIPFWRLPQQELANQALDQGRGFPSYGSTGNGISHGLHPVFLDCCTTLLENRHYIWIWVYRSYQDGCNHPITSLHSQVRAYDPEYHQVSREPQS